MQLLFEQILNGLQLGLLLFLVAAGLTLVFGVMDFMNLAHGSFFMIGAYLATTFIGLTGSFVFGGLIAVAVTALASIVVDQVWLKPLYKRSHLDQVLGTFGLVIFANDFVRLVWGASGRTIAVPQMLDGNVSLLGLSYPAYRLVIIAVGLIVALALYLLVQRTRVGMTIRAGASDAQTAGALGLNIPLVAMLVFGLGAAMAALAGLFAAPIVTVQIGMGDNMLIIALVIVVIGGIGSTRGAFVAALLVGLIDSIGRAYLPALLKLFLGPVAASTAAAALSSTLIYIILAAVLLVRPEGLFAGARR